MKLTKTKLYISTHKHTHFANFHKTFCKKLSFKQNVWTLSCMRKLVEIRNELSILVKDVL